MYKKTAIQNLRIIHNIISNLVKNNKFSEGIEPVLYKIQELSFVSDIKPQNESFYSLTVKSAPVGERVKLIKALRELSKISGNNLSLLNAKLMAESIIDENHSLRFEWEFTKEQKLKVISILNNCNCDIQYVFKPFGLAKREVNIEEPAIIKCPVCDSEHKI